MHGKLASTLFLGVCIALGIALVLKLLSPITGSVLFAIALVAFGLASKGFRR